MFIRNKTTLDVHLAHGHVTDDLAVAAVVVSLDLALAPGEQLAPLPTPLPPAEDDPPRDTLRVPLWAGVSVTASGHAMGPARAPFVCPVLFRIGAAERRLIVFGDRRWERRNGGALQPSAPVPFDRIPLGFERAFGGGYDLPPGLLPGTDLPHPGLRVAYPLNARGVGYYPNEQIAAGSPLPNVERPDQLLRRWNDTPEPAGFTPCRDLAAWRMKKQSAGKVQQSGALGSPAEAFDGALRLYHHAPPPLVFDDVPQGTPVELSGLGALPIWFVVPPAPARVTARTGKASASISPRLRALHVDADRRAVRAVFGHAFRYDPQRAPDWIRVQPAEGGVS
jgi:hypothetical protein